MSFMICSKMSQEYELIYSQKGKRKLYVNGFSFIKEKCVNETTYWKCDQWVHGCKSRAVLCAGVLSLKTETHNHEGAPEKYQISLIRKKVKEEAKTTKNTPQMIVSAATACLNEATAVHAPSVSSWRRMKG